MDQNHPDLRVPYQEGAFQAWEPDLFLILAALAPAALAP